MVFRGTNRGVYCNNNTSPTWCSVEVRHSNIPDADYETMVEDWNDSYFGSLRKFY